MNKRHAKPTTAQLVARIYRKQLAMEANQLDIGDIAIGAKEAIVDLQNEMRSAIRMLNERLTSVTVVAEENNVHLLALRRYHQTIKTLADHCARLLREKDTLQKINEYMAYPLKKHDDLMDESPPPSLPRICPCGAYPSESHKADCPHRPFDYDRCSFIHLHRPGTRCGVCGYIGMPNDAY